MSQPTTLAYWSDGFYDAELETAKLNDELQLFGADHHKLIQIPEGSTDEQIRDLVGEKIKHDVVNGSLNPLENISVADAVYSGFIGRWTSGEAEPKVGDSKEVVQKAICPNMTGSHTFTPKFIGEVMNAVFERAAKEGYLIDHGYQPGKRRYEMA